MAGSIRLVRPPDVWELRVFIGRDSIGRVRHAHHTFRGTRRGAERELARLVIAQDDHPAPTPEEPQLWGNSTTVNDAISRWKENGWDDLSPKTSRGYQEIWNRYVANSIGRQRISSLNPYEIERFFRKLKQDGCGPDTVRRVKSLLHRSCRLAARWSGGTLSNPVANTELPSWSLSEKGNPVRAPTPQEVRSLIAAAQGDDHRFAVFLRVVAATGMRRGEACALRWSDVDWSESALTVNESLVVAKGGAAVKSPKTRASIRRLAIDSVTLTSLSSLRSEQSQLAAFTGNRLHAEAFVFSVESGGSLPPHPDSMTHSFIRVRRIAGVSTDVHLHSLRHFQATVLDPVISERQKQARLGWSTVRMARHYTDVIEHEDRRAAQHLSQILDGDATADVPAPLAR